MEDMTINGLKKLLFLVSMTVCIAVQGGTASINEHAQVLRNVEMLLSQGEYEKAIQVIGRHEVLLDSSEPEGRAVLMYLSNKKGFAYAKLGNLCRAAAAFGASFDRSIVLKDQKPELAALNLISLANIYRGLNDRTSEEEVIDSFSEVLDQGADLSLEMTFSMLRALVLHRVDLDQVEEAENALVKLREALEAYNAAESDRPKAQLNLLAAAIQQARGNSEIAITLYEQAFDYLDVFNKENPPGLWFELANYARLQRSVGNMDEFNAAIEVAEAAIRHHRQHPELLLASIKARAQGQEGPVKKCECKK